MPSSTNTNQQGRLCTNQLISLDADWPAMLDLTSVMEEVDMCPQ
jgi:hypothetical protein